MEISQTFAAFSEYMNFSTRFANPNAIFGKKVGIWEMNAIVLIDMQMCSVRIQNQNKTKN